MESFNSTFKKFLIFLVNSACIGFVIWQSTKCIKTYIAKPIGTRLKMEKSSILPFPAITVCGYDKNWETDEASYFNDNYLENICDLR